MKPYTATQHQARRLVQLGLALFLLALVVGVLLHRFAVPRLALSAHLLGVLQGTFLLAIAAWWPKFSFTHKRSWLTFWLLAYGCVAAWLANLLAALWGAGNTLLSMAAGAARGSALQEGIIVVLLRSSAVALVAALVLLLWASRRTAPVSESS